MYEQMKRCWAEVSLSAIENNYREIKAKIGKDCRFLGIVKADAYGHGAVAVSKKLEQLGADYLAVAFIDEAVNLRNNGVKLPILILGFTPPEFTSELIQYELTQSVGSLTAAKEYSAEAEKAGRKLKCHLKLDSGMGRMGFTPGTPASELTAAVKQPWLDFEGAFTHFAVSDMPGEDNKAYTEAQYNEFITAVREVERARGAAFKIIHCANSGAVINYPQTKNGMVRPGIVLYGCYPCEEKGGLSLIPAMSLKCRVVEIKTIPAGRSVSYGRLWTAEKDTRIAVVSIGYADGLNRLLSGKIEFLIRGKRVKQIGRICMDMCMVDLEGAEDVRIGDEVLVFGRDASGSIPVETQSDILGTISYEILCSVSSRVPRVYTE